MRPYRKSHERYGDDPNLRRKSLKNGYGYKIPGHVPSKATDRPFKKRRRRFLEHLMKRQINEEYNDIMFLIFIETIGFRYE